MTVGPQPDRGLTKNTMGIPYGPNELVSSTASSGQGPPPGNRREDEIMAHRSVVPPTGQLIKTRDNISDPESSAAFTTTQSCSENSWCTTLLTERAELTKAVAADLPNHVVEHAALPVAVSVSRHYAAAVVRRLSKGVIKCR